MLFDIVKVKYLKESQIEIHFENGINGTIDLSKILIFTGVFEPLKNENFLSQVFVNTETGTIEWPNGADIDPITLYSKITGKPIVLENFSSKKVS